MTFKFKLNDKIQVVSTVTSKAAENWNEVWNNKDVWEKYKGCIGTITEVRNFPSHQKLKSYRVEFNIAKREERPQTCWVLQEDLIEYLMNRNKANK